MSPTLQQVREAVGVRLQTIPGLNVHAVVVGSITPPAAVVWPNPENPADYNTSYSASNDYSLVITLLVSRADDPAGQNSIDSYLDPSGTNSIPAAVNGTLGGLVDDAYVGRARRYGPIDYAGISYFGCEFPVQVMA